MSTPNEQLDLNDTLSGLIAMIPFFMMTKFVLSDPPQAGASQVHKPTSVKPVPINNIPTCVQSGTQEQPGSSFKPDLTPGLKGRAMSWPRPGWVIKEVLMKERTLYTCAYVSEASVIDLYKTYLCLINDENRLRDKYHKLKGPTLHSFDTYFRFAEYLGLVKKAGYEQTKSGIRRTSYKITQRGIDDDTSWDNLCGAWKEVRDKVVFKLPGSVVNSDT